MITILEPGHSCAQLVDAPRSGVLVDGRDFYRALYDAFVTAENYILMAGWQFASEVTLLRGADADGREHPVELVELLAELCEQRPELAVYILAWDASAIFTFEREPLQQLKFHFRGHKHIHYKMDNAHPFGASHHQKFIVVDRSIAFVGGMDVCTSRWDDRCHRFEDPGRCESGQRYAPFHDVQAYATGPAVDLLRAWFVERWGGATGDALELPAGAPAHEIAIQPTLAIDLPQLALARTQPPIRELYRMHVRAIEAADRSIYIENQYFSSDELGYALEQRMRRRTGDRLDIVIVLPEKSAGFKERISIGIYQQRILARLTKAALETGHRLGVYYSCACGDRGTETPVFIHAKVLAVDDRFLLVSSANASNRSMGFDTELGIAWETPSPCASIGRARATLLAEHAGIAPEDVQDMHVEHLNAIARGKMHRLRMHKRNADEKPGPLLARFIPDETPFDPDNAAAMEDMLPEPGAWLDKLLRDPFDLARQLIRR